MPDSILSFTLSIPSSLILHPSLPPFISLYGDISVVDTGGGWIYQDGDGWGLEIKGVRMGLSEGWRQVGWVYPHDLVILKLL